MRFLIAFGVPEKSVFTRLFCVFATVVLANFQDRLVMTASPQAKYPSVYELLSGRFQRIFDLIKIAFIPYYFSITTVFCQANRASF